MTLHAFKPFEYIIKYLCIYKILILMATLGAHSFRSYVSSIFSEINDEVRLNPVTLDAQD
jgi:type III secretory pathway component EscS